MHECNMHFILCVLLLFDPNTEKVYVVLVCLNISRYGIEALPRREKNTLTYPVN